MDKKILLEKTIEMYTNTIEEMKERGATTIDMVESAKKDVEEELENGVAQNTNLKKSIANNGAILPDNLIGDKNLLMINPLKKNMFLIDFAGIPEWTVRSVWHNDEYIYLKCREYADYSPYEYFIKNRDNIKGPFIIKYLDQVGAVIRKVTFDNVEIGEINISTLDYVDNDIVESDIVIKHNGFDIEIIGGNKIQ